ncbi:MAG: hypothetical protein ROM03_03330 [Mucispirillum sp.]|nr:hypothetical protein [Mucispirillum sp.]
MGKLIKIIIAFAVILLAAFVIRTVYFKVSGISAEEIVEKAKNQAEDAVDKALQQADDAVEESLEKAEKDIQEKLNK